jgi:hypothetical protein
MLSPYIYAALAHELVLRGCDRSAARGSVARGGPGAEGDGE